MSWRKTSINLGVLKEKESKNFKFQSRYPMDIIQVKPSCGRCTFVGDYDPVEMELPVRFKAEEIPKHLVNLKGSQDVRKSITVTYSDGTTEILSFTATIKKL